MYTITRGPSRLATQRRTGPSQQIEAKSGCDLKLKPVGSCPAPKLVFNRVNGKRCPTPGTIDTQEEEHTPAHEENVRFVYEAWQQVEEELGASQENGQCAHGPVHYVEKTPSQNLKSRCQDFVPIDLEEWWAKQFLANIQNSS
ncbi:MAPK regulated corepressor interacting protein 2 isoform X1 [Hemiscyllium ocellatum]|uniref:MAPK regulated corepressor interacting protein 2 isoform X1 n=1 Tax=Hemiscyllium ocellatum TaxID=170820 RepID=UPI002967134B|nr:MAPK regulated corepressor interacting protein 2 isoform X1 [Hemiscyllium ocellatum]